MSISVPDDRARGIVDVETTARKKDGTKKKKAIPIRKGLRCFVERKKLKYSVKADDPAYENIRSQDRDKFRYYGTVCHKGVGKSVYTIKFDLLPVGHQEWNISRNDITVVGKDEEEVPYDPKYEKEAEAIEECSTSKGKAKTPNYEEESITAFLNLPTTSQANAKSFDYKFGEGDKDVIKWIILADNEQITEDPMKHNDTSPIKADIDWNPDPSKVDYNQLLFDLFFPSLVGKAKTLDEYLESDNCSMRVSVIHDNIKFNRPDADDPDMLVSLS